MRIIGGRLQGRAINAPSNLKARPTTDFAKTGLFNILQNRVDFEGLTVLDLFAGTGSISLEFASRDAERVVAVEKDFRASAFLKSAASQFQLGNLHPVKSDVYQFLKGHTVKYNVVFADPPYDTGDAKKIHAIIFENDNLSADGILIIEHSEREKLSDLAGFEEERKYGNVRFSFFRKTNSL